jgi:hypothetical protein
VKESDPSAPASAQASAAGGGVPLRSRKRRIAIQNSAVGTMQKTHLSRKTAAVREGSRPSASLSRPNTGTARNDAPGAFAAYSLPLHEGGRARGSSHTSALSLTYPQSEYTGPPSRNPSSAARRSPMAYVPCSSIARAM